MDSRQNKALELLADFLSDNDIVFDEYSSRKLDDQITAEEIVEFLRNMIYND